MHFDVYRMYLLQTNNDDMTSHYYSIYSIPSIYNSTQLNSTQQGAILKDPNDIDVRTMSRSSSPNELLHGPLQFTVFMMWVGLNRFMTIEGAILVAALGIGDGIAAIVGE